jgi:stalled ribosome rescue protein Dom34
MRGIYKTISYKHKGMTTATNLGIWMDHSNAHLMEFTTEPLTTMIISSRFTHREKEHSIGKSENGMNQKERHEHLDYYKKIGEAIKNYQDVLLFGPTTAKTELFNLLKADHHFEKIRIETKDADKMTQNEQHAFVRNHFSRH